jgi:hypothetical protein
MIKKDWKFKTGLGLVIASVLLFFALPVIPFLEVEKKTKVIFSTSALIMAEVTFYTGGFLLGKQLFGKYKSLLNPKNWFTKKPVSTNDIYENEGDKS